MGARRITVILLIILVAGATHATLIRERQLDLEVSQTSAQTTTETILHTTTETQTQEVTQTSTQFTTVTTTVPPAGLDLTVSIVKNLTTCDSVTFTVTLWPSEKPSQTNVSVSVILIDFVFNVSTIAWNGTLMLSELGDSMSTTASFPLPKDATFNPTFSNAITVVVDPNQQIPERDESNNVMTVVGTCIG